MFVYRPMLHRGFRVDFMQIDAFLASKGIDPARYWVGPDGEEPAGEPLLPITIGYLAEPFWDAGPRARIRLRMGGRAAIVDTALPQALALLALTFDDPVYIAALDDTDPSLDAEGALDRFGLDHPGLLQVKVAPFAPGDHLAPEREHWWWYLVEDHGEVTRLAESIAPAPLAYMIYASWRAQETDLASRLAGFLPADSAAILNGEAG